jgi:tetratricopeptide (TPR) repeat protein
MEFKINPDKIKSVDYLLNRVVEKDHSGKPKFCFLLGAGCSIYSGIPSGWGVIERCRTISFLNNHAQGFKIKKDLYGSWAAYYEQAEKFRDEKKDEFEAFVKQTEEKFRRKLDVERIKEIIPDEIEQLPDFNLEHFTEKVFNDSLYGNWLDEYDQDPKERQMFIEHMIEVAEPAGDYILLASLIDSGIIHNVFTTNFDDLVNEALVNYYSIRARVYAHNEMARYISPISKRPNIIKLHGDYLYENIKNTTRETGDLEANMKTKFTEILNTLNLVVIGYGGADHSVMKVLEQAKNNHKYCLLWCSNDMEKLNWRVVHLVNSTDNSFFVHIPDFQTMVMKLWTNAEIKLPDLDVDLKQKKDKMEDFISMYNDKIKDTSEENQGKTIKEDYQQVLSKQVMDGKGTLRDDVDILSGIKEAGDWFNKAYYETDPDKQLDYYSKAIDLDNNYVDAYYNRGWLKNNQGKYQEAIKDFDIVLTIDPKYANAYTNRGFAYNNLHQYDLAIKDYNKAIELEPTNALNYYNLGCIHNDKNQFIKAIDNFNKAVEINPQYTDALYNRGWSKNMLGNLEGAINDFNKVITIDPNYINAYTSRGTAYLNQMQYKKAIDDYNKAIALNPNDAINYYNKGVTYNEMGDYEKAINQFDMAIEKDPNYINAYNNRGFSWHNLGEYAKAIDDYSKVLEVDHEYLLAYTNRALAYYNIESYEKAISDYEKAMELGAKAIVIFESLATLYILTNQFEKAENIIESARDIQQNISDETLLLYLFIIAKSLQNKPVNGLEKKLDDYLKKEIIIDWDFDRIGKWISKLKPQEKHQFVSDLTKKLKENINQDIK